MPNPMLNFSACCANHWQEYSNRCEAVVAHLGAGCVSSEEKELDRFRWCRTQLSPGDESEGRGARTEGSLTDLLPENLPTLFEFILTHSPNRAPAFAYLSQGRPDGSFPNNLASLLEGSVKILLGSGGKTEDAECLADLFALAFPSLQRLADCAPSTQAMLVAVAPNAQALDLKIYFNTRLDPGTPHREKVVAMVERAGGADAAAALSALRLEDDRTRFHGVGVDLTAETSRAKLYIHLPRDAAIDRAEEILKSLGQSDATAREVRPILSHLLEQVGGTAALDMVELACALRRDGKPSLKATIFFAAKRVGEEQIDLLSDLLEEAGYDAALLHGALERLGPSLKSAIVQPHPLHGVGVELPVGSAPKINLYLVPVI